MSVSTIRQNNYQNEISAQKRTKHTRHSNNTNTANLQTTTHNSTEESTKTQNTSKRAEAEEMAAFKKEFYAEIERIPRDRTIANVAIHISEEGFQNMKNDPKYREQMLSLIWRDLTGSVAPAPDCSLILTIGATAKDYRGDSWSVNHDAEFDIRSQNSFYKKTTTKKNTQKKRLKEYLEKRAQARKVQQKLFDEKQRKQELENIRLSQLENHERQMTKAANAYEKNFQIADSPRQERL